MAIAQSTGAKRAFTSSIENYMPSWLGILQPSSGVELDWEKAGRRRLWKAPAKRHADSGTVRSTHPTNRGDREREVLVGNPI